MQKFVCDAPHIVRAMSFGMPEVPAEDPRVCAFCGEGLKEPYEDIYTREIFCDSICAAHHADGLYNALTPAEKCRLFEIGRAVL